MITIRRGELCDFPIPISCAIASRASQWSAKMIPIFSFFAQRNPGHAAGDELVCLTEIHPDNLTRAGRRVWPVESLCLTA